MRFPIVILLPLAAVLIAGCSRSRDDSAARERGTPAYEVGRAAHEVAKESGKVAKAAGRELRNGAREAHEGWQDQSRRDRAREQPKEKP